MTKHEAVADAKVALRDYLTKHLTPTQLGQASKLIAAYVKACVAARGRRSITEEFGDLAERLGFGADR